MKPRYLFIMLFLATTASLSAKFIQEIELKDGSILKGYIFKQQPNNRIVFRCEDEADNNKEKILHKDKDYVIRWEDLKFIRNSEKSDDQTIDDRITLKNGTVYIGRIVEQQPAVSMKMRLKDSDETVRINSRDIMLTEKIPGNEDANLWLDTPYLNQLRLSDDSIREGVIVTQYRGESMEDSYVELLHSSGYRERIFLPEIKEYIISIR